MMETLRAAWGFYQAHSDVILMILFYILSVGSVFISAIRKQLTMREAIILVINTLKDEDKMESGGAAFKEATVEKIEKVATVVGAGQAAVAEVKSAITTVNTRDTTTANPGDLKIGSYKGKPVFLSDATGIGSKLWAALQVVRGILHK